VSELARLRPDRSGRMEAGMWGYRWTILCRVFLEADLWGCMWMIATRSRGCMWMKAIQRRRSFWCFAY
jgi:hypothetical protein